MVKTYSRKNRKSNDLPRKMLSNFFKQLLFSIVCFSIILLMKNSGTSIGKETVNKIKKSITYNVNIKEKVQSASALFGIPRNEKNFN